MTVTEETKKFVTPYAFHVARDLLGKPLASPSKRFFAILIDMILVGLLTTLNGLILTGLIGVVALVGAKKLRKKPGRGLAAGFLLATFVVCFIAVLAGALISENLELDVPLGDDTTVNSTELTEPAAELTLDPQNDEEQTIRIGGDNKPEPSLIEWAHGAITDLGLSFGWAALYFTAFVAWMNGQTPGKLMFGIRVIRIDGKELSLWDSFGRYGGYGAGFATGLLGFLQIYWDANRQAIQDKISETMVVDVRKPAVEVSAPTD